MRLGGFKESEIVDMGCLWIRGAVCGEVWFWLGRTQCRRFSWPSPAGDQDFGPKAYLSRAGPAHREWGSGYSKIAVSMNCGSCRRGCPLEGLWG